MMSAVDRGGHCSPQFVREHSKEVPSPDSGFLCVASFSGRLLLVEGKGAASSSGIHLAGRENAYFHQVFQEKCHRWPSPTVLGTLGHP